MKERRSGLIAAVITATILLTACSSKPVAPSQPQQTSQGSNQATAPALPKEVRIGFQIIPNSEMIVKGKGWLEQRLGVPIQWKQFDSGRDVNAAIAAGAIDIGLVGSSPTAAGIAQGLPYEFIWAYDIIGKAESLVVRKSANITKASDLIGKKIATPFGSTSHYSLLKYLEYEKVDPTKVQILDMQPQDMLAAWTRGDLDGGWVWHPILQKMLDSGAVVLYDASRMAQRGAITGDFCVVSKAFAQKYPEIVAKYLRAQADAVTLLRTQPDDAYAAVAKELNIKPDESKQIMADYVFLDGNEQLAPQYLGKPGQIGDFAKVLLDAATFLKDQKIVQSVPDLATFQKNVNPAYLAQGMQLK